VTSGRDNGCVYEEHMIHYRRDKERQDNWHNAAYHLAEMVGRIAMRGRWEDPDSFYRKDDTVETVTSRMIATYRAKKRLTSKTGLWVSPDTERVDNISNSDLPKWSIKE